MLLQEIKNTQGERQYHTLLLHTSQKVTNTETPINVQKIFCLPDMNNESKRFVKLY